MDSFNAVIRQILQWYYTGLGALSPAAKLAIIAFVAAIVMLWVFKKTSNPKRIRVVKRLVQAHLLEMRLFRDEPAVVWRAQGSLLSTNARYIGLMLLPALWLALPLTLLMVHLDAFYGRTPLPLNQDSIVTMAMRAPIDPQSQTPLLVAPAGIEVSTPPVRIMSERQISWRIRPTAVVSGNLQFQVNGQTIDKRIEAGGASRFVPGLRPSSWIDSLWHPNEPRLNSTTVDWIDVRYPAVDLTIFGLQLHWVLWFTIISMVLALLMRKRFGVVL